MKSNILIFTSAFLFILTGCLKQKAERELENQQILEYIASTGFVFDTLNSNVFLHINYYGFENQNIKKGDSVRIIYTGYNIDKKKYFATDDTIDFIAGSSEIQRGWNEIILEMGIGGSGIAIFPYYEAFGGNQTPNTEANSTLVYFFRIASNNYLLEQFSLFWQFTGKYSNILYSEDTLAYSQYFEGLGNNVSQSGTVIDFRLFDIFGNLLEKDSLKNVDFSTEYFCTGLKQGLLNMKEGEMGLIVIPPTLSYQTTNPFGLLTYSTLYAETRIVSQNPEIEQTSKINKYLYLNNFSPDSITPTGIYYIKIVNPQVTAPEVKVGDTITYSDSLFFINTKNVINKCTNCEAVVNSSNFFTGQLQGILLMQKGETAKFILPYSQAFGSTGNDSIPGYSTLVYRINITNIR